MSTLDELKNKWTENSPIHPGYDAASLEKIIKTRVGKHLNASIQYFWASFAFHVLVYSMLSHVIIKYWDDSEVLFLGVSGFLLFIPLTILLMRRFKRLASAKPATSNVESEVNSVFEFVIHQKQQLVGIYNLKTWYDVVLTPMSLAIGVFLAFKLYVPGGVAEHWAGAGAVFIGALLSCVVAIRSENSKSFKKPIHDLHTLVDEFRKD